MKVTINDLQKLTEITTPADIKSFEVRDVYEDDHQQCAEVTINGIDVEFMWFDNVGFIEYWDESKKAFKDLRNAITAFVQQRAETLHDDGDCTLEEFNDVYDKAERYFESLHAEYVAARK